MVVDVVDCMTAAQGGCSCLACLLGTLPAFRLMSKLTCLFSSVVLGDRAFFFSHWTPALLLNRMLMVEVVWISKKLHIIGD